jgi:hypothetical protein
LIVLSLVPLLRSLLDLDIRDRGHHGIWTFGFVLGIVLAAVGVGFVAAAGILGRRNDRE